MSETQTKTVLPLQDDATCKQGLTYGVAVVAIVLILGIIGGIAYYLVNTETQTAEKELRMETGKVVLEKRIALNDWLNSYIGKAEGFAGNDLTVLFAEQVATMGDDAVVIINSGAEKNREQTERMGISYMQDGLNTMAVAMDCVSGRMLTAGGEVYLASAPNLPLLQEFQKTMVKHVVDSKRPAVSNAYSDPNLGLVIDFYLPVMSSTKKDAKPTSVVMFTKAVTAKLREIIANASAFRPAGHNLIIQRNGTSFQDLSVGRGEILRNIGGEIELDENGEINFAVREAMLPDRQQAFSQGGKLGLLDWWVVHEVSYKEAKALLGDKVRTIYTVAGLSALVIMLGLAVLWWYSVGTQRKNAMSKVQSLFSVIDEQKRLLDGINSTIADPISLTDPKGTYRYVNRAFALNVGREADKIVGLDTAAIFGFDTAKRLNASDQHVLMTGEGITASETIWLQSRKHYFQISKTPLRVEGVRTPQGIVSVFRDMTQVVEAEERTNRVVEQTIDTLVQAIEEADPFLGGHSRIMSGIAVLIGRALQFNESEISTIQSAANLSQIGKMYVPREILTKPGALTPEEKKVMEQHIEYTKSMVSRIEFGLPVLDAIYQMHERLDGKGYPQGLQGNDINIYARVLAVANSFTAMARPRSYRPALTVDEAVGSMENNQGAFDPHVVEVLRAVLATPAGERYVQMAAASKAL